MESRFVLNAYSGVRTHELLRVPGLKSGAFDHSAMHAYVKQFRVILGTSIPSMKTDEINYCLNGHYYVELLIRPRSNRLSYTTNNLVELLFRNHFYNKNIYNLNQTYLKCMIILIVIDDFTGRKNVSRTIRHILINWV